MSGWVLSAETCGTAVNVRVADRDDPDSQMLRSGSGQRFVQGYEAQAAVTGEQVVIAAQVANAAPTPRICPRSWLRPKPT